MKTANHACNARAVEQEPPQKALQCPLFSVIIPVRNEELNIERCLASLCRLKGTSELFEVIIVNNGSTDRTCEVASAYLQCLPIRILNKKDAYIAAVRNAGASVARGAYLAFLDGDCEVSPDWLSHASIAISSGTNGVFGSFYRIPNGSSWIARYWHEFREKKERGRISYVPSSNLFVNRNLFERIRGFDETLQTNEDYEFCQRAKAAGVPVTCIPELTVIHWGTPQSFDEFFRQNRWHGMHVFRVFLRHLPALYNVKAVALTFYTFICLAGILAGGAILLASGQPRVLGGFVFGLIAPPVFLGIRSAVSSRRLHAALPLAALYLAYAIARVSSLLDWRSWILGTTKGRSWKIARTDRER